MLWSSKDTLPVCATAASSTMTSSHGGGSASKVSSKRHSPPLRFDSSSSQDAVNERSGEKLTTYGRHRGSSGPPPSAAASSPAGCTVTAFSTAFACGWSAWGKTSSCVNGSPADSGSSWCRGKRMVCRSSLRHLHTNFRTLSRGSASATPTTGYSHFSSSAPSPTACTTTAVWFSAILVGE